MNIQPIINPVETLVWVSRVLAYLQIVQDLLSCLFI